MSSAPREENRIAGLVAKSDADNTPVILEADPITKRLKVTATISGGGSGGTQYAEDTPHTSGDLGNLSLAIRNDSLNTLTNADGDYSGMSVDSLGRTAIFQITPGIGGSDLGKAEDAAHSSGHTGVMALAVRNDTGAALAGTDGDYIPLTTDASGALRIDMNGTLSTNNSSTATLTSGSVFTGTGEDVLNYNELRVSVFSNVASATDGLSLQQSPDNTNWDITDVYTISAGVAKTIAVPRQARYFRVVYTNGGTNQASFRLWAILNREGTQASSQRASDGYTNETDLQQMQSFGMLYNGTTWDRQKGDAVGGTIIQARPDATTTGTIVANGGTVVAAVVDGMQGFGFAYYGTYATGATLTWEASADGGTTYTAFTLQAAIGLTGPVTVIAAVSNSQSFYEGVLPTGATHVRIRCSAWAAPTGTINIRLVQSSQPRVQTTNVISSISGVASVTAGVAATSLGKAEDAVATSGDTGVFTLGIQTASPADTAADGDYVGLQIKNGRLFVSDLSAPVATALNTYATRITSNTTTTPTSSTAYISSITITTEVAGTTSTVTIRDKQGTPQVLVNGLTTTAASLTPTVLNFQTPVKMTSGIDIVTAGAVAGTVDVWINYYA